jgi:hypothetical protein
VVGAATFDALLALHHIWGGKSVPVHSASSGGPLSRNALLAGTVLELIATDGDAYRVARRVANLAQAAQPEAQITVVRGESAAVDVLQEQQDHLRVVVGHTTEGIVLSGDCNLTLPIPYNLDIQASQQGFQHLATVILDVICRF